MEITSTKTLSFDEALELYNQNPVKLEDKAVAEYFFNKGDLDNKFVNKFPKDWEDFCANYKTKHNEGECYISTSSEIREVKAGDAVNNDTDKNLVPNKQCADAVLALTQLLQLREFYRQGWKPSHDYSDDYYAVSISVTYENDYNSNNPDNKYKNSIILNVIKCSNDSNDSNDDFPEFHYIFTFKYKDIAEAFITNHEDLLKEYAKIYL